MKEKVFKIKQLVVCWYCSKEVTEFGLEYNDESPWRGSAHIVCKECMKDRYCLK